MTQRDQHTAPRHTPAKHTLQRAAGAPAGDSSRVPERAVNMSRRAAKRSASTDIQIPMGPSSIPSSSAEQPAKAPGQAPRGLQSIPEITVEGSAHMAQRAPVDTQRAPVDAPQRVPLDTQRVPRIEVPQSAPAANRVPADPQPTQKSDVPRMDPAANRVSASGKPTPRRTARSRAKRNDEPTVRGRVPFAQGHVSMAQVQETIQKRRKTIGIIGLVLLCVIILAVFHAAEQGKFDAAKEKAAQGDYAAAQTAFSGVVGIPLLAFPEAGQMATECQYAVDAKAAAEKGDYQAAVDLYDKIDLLKKETGRDRCFAKAYLAAENEEWITLAKNILAITKADYEYDYCDNPANETEREIAIRRKSNSTEVRGKDAAGKMLTLDITVPSDDKELVALTELMKNGIAYDTAKRWYDEGDFANAAVTFEKLGDFRDAASYTTKAYDAAYRQASDLAAKGEYFKARTAFTTIGSYKDAQARAEACVQPLPENGSLNTGNGPDCAITISVPDSAQPTYIRFYNESGMPCGSIFVHPGNQAVVNLLGGSYYIKTASGTDWYGEVDLFGDTGTYQQVSYGTAGMFPLDTGATYNLTVGGQSGGNISTTNLESAADLNSAK